MKRAYMIAGGTIGGLGAVLSITPPSFLSNESAAVIGAQDAALTTSAPGNSAATSTEASPTASASKSTSTTTKKATTTKSAAANNATDTSQNANTNNTATASPAPAATKSATATPIPSAKSASSGKFTGDLSSVGPYGGVVVQVTVSGGKITDVQTLQAPGGRDQRYTDMSVPVLRQRVIAAQGANISGVSGASYTSYNFWMSLKSALSKAGL